MKAFGAVVALVVALVILPFISFWLSYFGGWITAMVIGGPLCTALNTLFQTTMFTPEILPWVAGALGWIGGYFKSTNTNIQK